MSKNHVTDSQLGGKRVRLAVIDSNEPSFSVEIHGGTWKRSECPTQRPCPRVFCRANLLRVDGPDRAGRKGLSKVTRNALGMTISEPGLREDDRKGTLEPRWLETPMPESCVWDVLEAAAGEPMSPDEIGEAIGRHRTLVGRLVRAAVAKLRAAGVTLDDLRSLIDPEIREGNLASVIRSGH